jgi:hypothetical protein
VLDKADRVEGARQAERRDWIGRSSERPSRPSRLAEYLLRAPEPGPGPARAALASELARTQERVAELEARLAVAERELEAVQEADANLLFAESETAGARQVVAVSREYEPGPRYWLCRCEGFRVEAAGRRLGTVRGLRYGARVDLPDLLEMRTMLGHRQLLRVEEVERIDGQSRQIVMRRDPRPQRSLGDHVLRVLRSRRQRADVTAGAR